MTYFMLFSGVSWPKSALTMASVWLEPRVPWSPIVPKYLLPLATRAVFTLLEAGPVEVPVWSATLPVAADEAGAADAVEACEATTLDLLMVTTTDWLLATWAIVVAVERGEDVLLSVMEIVEQLVELDAT